MLPINAVILQRNGSGHGQATIPSASVGQRPANRTEADRVRYSSLFVAAGHRSRARGITFWLKAFAANTMQLSPPHELLLISATLK